jgi:hypothetical protein
MALFKSMSSSLSYLEDVTTYTECNGEVQTNFLHEFHIPKVKS